MRARHAFLVAGLLGCSAAAIAVAAELEAGPAGRASSLAPPMPGTPAAPATPFPTDRVTVDLISVTLGDDCNPPAPAPGPKKSAAPAQEKAAASESMADSAQKPGFAPARARRACEQTSMQLVVNVPAGLAATQLAVKKVELYDEKGKLVGKLTPRSPTRWTGDGTYVAWDEKLEAAQLLQVSYELSAPEWSKVKERWNKTFTVKAVVTVGGADQKLKRDVYVVGETHLPPGVVT